MEKESWTERIAKMRYEVIENTIKIENLLDELILLNFKMEIDINGDYRKWREETEVFKKHFLNRAPVSKKFEIIKEIIRDNWRKEIPSDFSSDVGEFLKIRNIFAHQLSPELGEDMCSIEREMIEKDKDKLIELHKMHCQLYSKLLGYIVDTYNSRPN